MIEDWIDELCNVWAGIEPNDLVTVRSPRLVGDYDRFPSAIVPASDFPIALTIPDGLAPVYSVGGPRIAHYSGLTEFHVAPSCDKNLLPSLVKWYGLILSAAAGNMTLNGKVEHFFIPDTDKAIAGPMALQYGDETPHWGFVVQWVVKEHLTITVA